jgi:cytochrome c-type biogenesis protein CcmE
LTRKKQRLVFLLLGMTGLGGAIALMLSALGGNLVFFYTPSELERHPAAAAERVRIGGLVEARSVKRDGTSVAFRITDGKTDIRVRYRGVLPDLFREGQGVVAEGRLLPDGRFLATSVLAKHDENYMPRWVARGLKKNGKSLENAAAGAPPNHFHFPARP